MVKACLLLVILSALLNIQGCEKNIGENVAVTDETLKDANKPPDYEFFSNQDIYYQMGLLYGLRESAKTSAELVDFYSKILNSKNGSLRIKEITTINLGMLGRQAHATLPILADIIESSAIQGHLSEYCIYAADAIGKIGPPVDNSVIQALVNGADHEQDSSLRTRCTYACINALSNIGEDGREGLFVLMCSKNEDVWPRALFELCRSGMLFDEISGRVDRLVEPRKSNCIKFLKSYKSGKWGKLGEGSE